MQWSWNTTDKLRQLEKELQDQRSIIVALQNKNLEQQMQIDALTSISSASLQTIKLLQGNVALINFSHDYKIDVPISES